MTSAQPIELYRKREKIYPRAVSGIFARFRITGVLVLLGIFYGLPWLPWPMFADQQRQAVLFDLPNRKFYLFEWVFWPQDFLFLSGLLILCALALFFFTALAGRLWCGYACPQTVWTEVFMWIENWIEGTRIQQIKRDKAPMSSEKFWRKSAKHAVWLILSLHTGYTFVGYFTPLDVLTHETLTATLGPWELFWILFYGFATYGNAGWMREQVCLYMCPYARFQSAMFDAETLIISYDEARGEPRKRGRNANDDPPGDCVNCQLCVQVCPTGIDIRDGLQYECIGCAACIDACDEVMEKVDKPKGLIRYTTESVLQGKPSRIMRPRIYVYTVLLVVLVSVLGFGLANRIPLELDIIRDRNALFREASNGYLENVYTVRVMNMEERDHTYTLNVDGELDFFINGKNTSIDIQVPAGEVASRAISLQVDPYTLTRSNYEIFISITSQSNAELTRREPARFLGPDDF
ncbi:MAG: cytochrome c oxidase accessory protein CcoG [Pseudomonadota bacterium]